ncbi:MAG: GNAT family N-acetyltransferase [Nitriliruptoraceae bacterium]
MQLHVRRARIEEIRALADEYRQEQIGELDVAADVSLPQGGVFWIAENDAGTPVGYAAAALGPSGCTVGPIYTRPQARRHGVGRALIEAIQAWAIDTRVPIVEISVAAPNHVGRAFLESLGYQPRRIVMSLTPAVLDD